MCSHQFTGRVNCQVVLVHLKAKTSKQVNQQENRAGESAQWIRALAALTEDLGLVRCTHMVVYSHLELMPSVEVVHRRAHKYTQARYSYTENKASERSSLFS